MTTQDLPHLVRYYNETDAPGHEARPVDEDALRGRLLRAPAGQTAHAFGLFEDGDVRGFAAIHVPTASANGTGRLRRLVAGRAEDADRLLDAAVAFARAEGAPRVRGVAGTATERATLRRRGWPVVDAFLEMRRDGNAPAMRPHEWRVADAAPADDADVARVVTEAFADATYRGPWGAEDAAAARAKGPCVVVRDTDAHLLGFAAVRPREGERGACEIEHVAVAAAARGRGVGRVVTAAALEAAVTHGWGTQYLYVNVRNTPARRIYDTLGFEVADEYRIHELAF